jgi:3',5'-cyclic-nucleotide phosphodiesterase
MSFEITFLGASGGPVEGITCSMLLKSSDVSYNEILSNNLPNELICVDAGSGIGLLSELIYNELHNISPQSKQLRMYNDMLSLEQCFKTKITRPFAGLSASVSPYEQSQEIFKLMNNYLISHAHMDHIAALVINSAGFCKESPKNVYGSRGTIDTLQRHVFNGLVWPNMSKFNMVKLSSHEYWQTFSINDTYSVTIFDLSHGKMVPHDENTSQRPESPNYSRHTYDDNFENYNNYISSAFLVTHELSNSSVLIFGDFEADTVSKLGKNKRIWCKIAPMLLHPEKQLKGIILECSTCQIVSTNELYGHIMPTHLINELRVLNDEILALIPSSNRHNMAPLAGFNVVINHVKEAPNLSDPRREILSELEILNHKYELGIHFSVALNGASIVL